MKSTIAIIASILAVIAAVLIVKCKKKKVSEHFDATGLIFNKPSEWFNKSAYNVDDWLVAYYPDQLSKPGGCDMHYRGNQHDLNYLSSAYRFWRM